MEKSKVTIRHIMKISELSKKPKRELRKLNADQGGLCCGMELIKEELIYQLVFLMDAPKQEL